MKYPLNNRVKAFQKSTGLTTADFSQQLDLHSASVLYNAFRGRNRIGTEVLEAIAKNYQPDMNQFFYDSAEMHKPTTSLQVAEDQAQYSTKSNSLVLENKYLKEMNELLKETIAQQKTTIEELRNARKS